MRRGGRCGGRCDLAGRCDLEAELRGEEVEARVGREAVSQPQVVAAVAGATVLARVLEWPEGKGEGQQAAQGDGGGGVGGARRGVHDGSRGELEAEEPAHGERRPHLGEHASRRGPRARAQRDGARGARVGARRAPRVRALRPWHQGRLLVEVELEARRHPVGFHVAAEVQLERRVGWQLERARRQRVQRGRPRVSGELRGARRGDTAHTHRERGRPELPLRRLVSGERAAVERRQPRLEREHQLELGRPLALGVEADHAGGHPADAAGHRRCQLKGRELLRKRPSREVAAECDDCVREGQRDGFVPGQLQPRRASSSWRRREREDREWLEQGRRLACWALHRQRWGSDYLGVCLERTFRWCGRLSSPAGGRSPHSATRGEEAEGYEASGQAQHKEKPTQGGALLVLHRAPISEHN